MTTATPQPENPDALWAGVPEPRDKKHKNGSLSPSMWSRSGNNFFACEDTTDKLPSGQYKPMASQQKGYFFQKIDVNLDDVFVLPDNESERILKSMQSFWGKKDHFQNYGFLWKRGILMYGPPGGGKTVSIQLLSKRMSDEGGITIIVEDPSVASNALHVLRQVERERPLLVVMEDIDTIIEDYGESAVLSLLDGEFQIDNVVYLATTNYPEDLDKRITCRPSRFDEVIEVKMPTEKARRAFLEAKISEGNRHLIEEMLPKTNEFSIAHLKELVISTEILGRPVDETLHRIRQMIDRQPKSSDTGRGIGFS